VMTSALVASRAFVSFISVSHPRVILQEFQDTGVS
jgi:hypothetical protein